MFRPNFRYTDAIVGNLTGIAEARAIVLNAPLVPKWDVSLRRDALIRSAHSSTAIEGNPLSLDQVSDLAAGRDIMVKRKDKQEVLNYLNALEKIPSYAGKASLTLRDILEIHLRVTKDTLDNPLDERTLRTRQVIVGNRLTGEVVFRPPDTKDVPHLMDDFLKWLNASETEKVDPVIVAGIAHYEFVRIHPFIDGNGRTTRVLASLILCKRGFDARRYFALDDYYDHDRRKYYEALRRVNPKTIDLTGWLEYFTGGIRVSVKAVQDRVIGISKDIKVLKDRGQISLTDRQMKIVEYVLAKGKISNKELRELVKLSDEGALKEMMKMIDLGVVRRKGKGRTIHYVLA